mmetsp:Transcript_42196/g.101522  ORF Transcript_42196/g.101522 Transcript_42196/m.101522 type:complete len:212 (-) Transcript_42196:146-781(-)
MAVVSHQCTVESLLCMVELRLCMAAQHRCTTTWSLMRFGDQVFSTRKILIQNLPRTMVVDGVPTTQQSTTSDLPRTTTLGGEAQTKQVDLSGLLRRMKVSKRVKLRLALSTPVNQAARWKPTSQQRTKRPLSGTWTVFVSNSRATTNLPSLRRSMLTKRLSSNWMITRRGRSGSVKYHVSSQRKKIQSLSSEVPMSGLKENLFVSMVLTLF